MHSVWVARIQSGWPMSDHTERLARLMQEEITLEAWAVSGVCEHCSDPATFAALWSDRGPVFVCDRHRDEVRRGYLGDHNYDQTGLLWHQLTGAAPPREATPEGPWHDGGVDQFHEGGEWVRVVTDAREDLVLEIPTGEFDRTAASRDERSAKILARVLGAPPGRNTPP